MPTADTFHVALGCSWCGYLDNRHAVLTRWSSPALETVEDGPRASGASYRLVDPVPGLGVDRGRFHGLSRCAGCGARFCWWILTGAGRVREVVPVESLDGRCEACRARGGVGVARIFPGHQKPCTDPPPGLACARIKTVYD